MTGRASAFAVLGLDPSADSAAVERAYRRLIKKYHPDHEGGDGVRAAEIIRAYRLLRGGRALADPLQFNEEISRRRRRRRWPLAAAVVLACAGAAIASMGSLDPSVGGLRFSATQVPPHHTFRTAAAMPEPMHEELHVKAIDAAAAEALRLFRTRDEMALAAASRDCQRRFREDPGTRMLDRCAAFDDAVVGLQDRDPLRDQGPFAALAVTGRQWSAASSLSQDDLEIDTRLDRIRLRVELLLAPEMDPIPPTPPPAPAPATD
jgi:hypothetical protein